jgi:hypothetical protein
VQPFGVARRGFDDRIHQAWETRVKILAAKLHVTGSPDDAGLDQTGFAQFREMIRQI